MPQSSPQPHPSTAFFLDHLATESARFRQVLTGAPATAAVPSCPEWSADDLLWHLGEVQWFWGEIAQRRATTGEQLKNINGARVSRPTDRAGLLEHFDRSSERLHRVLSGLNPDTELWMWADDHSAAYIARRQAHEAMVHRLDAELTVGARTPLDASLAADGVDEALMVMRGYEPEEGLSHTSFGGTVLVTVWDSASAPSRRWSLDPVRVTGSADGEAVDVTRFMVEPVPWPESNDGRPLDHYVPCNAMVQGSAEDLDCWLWNRPVVGDLHRQGDDAALAAVDEVLGGGIN